MKSVASIGLFSAAVVCLVWNVQGGDSCGTCPRCGCGVTKVCRIVPVITKVPKVEYSCKCGDICVLGKSQCVGTECVTDCNGCTINQKVYEPNCGRVYTTVTPEKKTTMVDKCTYKCVVECVCEKCGCGCGGGNTGNSAHSYAPSGGGVVIPHEEPHPLHKQSN